MSVYCRGDKVYLRPVQLSDVPLIVKWKKDPYIQRMTLYPGVEITAESQEQDIRRAVEADELYMIIVIKKTDTPIGYMRVNSWQGQPGCVWLRYALGEERGKGYGTDALKCFIRRLFDEGVHRFDTEIYAFNTVALAFLGKLGFIKEGVKRKAFFDGEKYVDLVVLGLLKEDFKL
jgi:ribosomal-protein-alanine N-acetyltransferase